MSHKGEKIEKFRVQLVFFAQYLIIITLLATNTSPTTNSTTSKRKKNDESANVDVIVIVTATAFGAVISVAVIFTCVLFSVNKTRNFIESIKSIPKELVSKCLGTS